MPNGTSANYAYDSLGQMTGLANKKSDNSVISSYGYGFDARGVKTYVEQQVMGRATQRVNYSYDDVNQLTGETATETSAITDVPHINNSFAYDGMGNRSTNGATSLANGSNVSSYTTATVTNRLNQVTSQTITSLVNGVTSSTRTESFNYDSNGNLNTQSNDLNSAGTACA